MEPHGGGHGHFDKLNLMLYANGREWLLDPGRLAYNFPEYKTWVKETVAHNTVTLGGQSQRATTGKLLFLQQGNGFSACGAQSEGAYAGARLTRFLLLTPDFLAAVQEKQRAILAFYAPLLRSGGKLVYATCSILPISRTCRSVS